jgi:hypothetical protein
MSFFLRLFLPYTEMTETTYTVCRILIPHKRNMSMDHLEDVDKFSKRDERGMSCIPL